MFDPDDQMPTPDDSKEFQEYLDRLTAGIIQSIQRIDTPEFRRKFLEGQMKRGVDFTDWFGDGTTK